MNEANPKSQGTRRPLRLKLIGLWVFVFTAVVTGAGLFLSRGSKPGVECLVMGLVTGLAAAIFSVGAVGLYRWLHSWRNVRRFVVMLAVLGTLIAVFYAEENWRCKRDWDEYKQKKVAAGNWHEWDEYVPAPVPDGENVFAAPHIAEAFTKGRKDAWVEECRKKFTTSLQTNPTVDVPVAELVWVLPGEKAPGDVAAELAFADGDMVARVRAAVEQATGPRFIAPQQQELLTRTPDAIRPVRLAVRADHVPSARELETAFPAKGWPLADDRLPVTSQGQVSRLYLRLSGWCLATNYLQASAANEPFYEALDAALQRPKVRMNGSYDIPWDIDIPNFVLLRNVAQDLAARAQCHVLLGQPEEAIRELGRMKRLQRFTVGQQGPMTLVSAMINVAIHGLYAHIIADGMRQHAWNDAQLAELQRQIGDTDLLPPAQLALTMERVAINRSCDRWRADPEEFVRAMTGTVSRLDKKELSAAAKREVLVLRAIPTGWYYQNQLVYNQTMDEGQDEAYDGHQVSPKKAAAYGDGIERRLISEHWPYGRYARLYLAGLAIPNYIRAVRTVALNQTLLNQARIACALERYRLARGGYPETLDVLAPQYLGEIPRDLIGGGPLHYQRTGDGSFLLYSIGWDEKDDGGKTSRSTLGWAEVNAADWVWDAVGR